MNGTVYLIHLDAPLGRCRHYVGWANNVDARLHYHRTGRGARFLAVCNERGITYQIVRQWEGGKLLERAIKQGKNAPRLCPVCSRRPQDRYYSRHVKPQQNVL